MQKTRSLLLFVLVAAAVPCFAAARSPIERLSNPRGDVIVAYGKISEVSGSERVRLYSTMSPTMQADLWMLHLEYFLEDHDELTLRQRVAIQDAMRFIGSGAFSISRESAEWPTKVQAPLKKLEFRMTAALGFSLAREAAAHLGPEEYGVNLSVVTEHQQSTMTNFRPKPLNANCECATGDDDLCCFGDCPTSSAPKCHAGMYDCIETRGCGWLWLAACTGICGA